ncbi:hypothetical protein S1OALGB6SA_1800 [Olavius algarvensis spirochete endosymbiont]|uniref:hypothetical protein n=1 Tax=Olavius algarvensis spirochete endosymbiont TaxID=260710 RepID=UPI00052D445F|nr:hypothetical protein [Olavius algarvensis spirochete endosymbiont]KGM43613.1 hypothetical protein JY97_06190 [Alkalispirochaeta odontotermitis]CAD7837326.1 MAG: hypothetical protein [Olavius algarvensis spirochete endosymbiont]VDB00712.1 hypothetical protein S1OALGB6SA_1800 [Olavius algarvensis spirochete endosymbiont]
MRERVYSQAMRNELSSLMKLATNREAEKRLNKISTVIRRWKRNKSSARRVLDEIHSLSASTHDTWTSGVDPGIPIAHALVAGYLQREDISDSTWKMIEALVTLAGI